MAWKFNPFTQTFDEIGDGGSGYPIEYKIGSYTNFQKVNAAISQATFNQNFYWGAVSEVLTPVKISAPRIKVSLAAAGNAIIALYKFDGTQWVLVDQTVPFSTAIIAVISTTWTTGTLSLESGIYLFAVQNSGGNRFDTVISPGLSSNYFGLLPDFSAAQQCLQLYASPYTGTALATMPLALNPTGLIPNILNLITA